MDCTLTGLPLPLTIHPSEPMSDEDLMAFSGRNQPYKIERNNRGEIAVMTPVGGIGGTHEIFVSSALFLWAELDGRGIAFGSNAGFNLPDGSTLSPDAAWLSLNRWNALTPDQQASFPPLCPEFIIEVRSRTDSRRLLEAKMQLWLDNGADLAWLIDPTEGNATIYRLGVPPVTQDRPQIVLGAGPMTGFELRTARLWT